MDGKSAFSDNCVPTSLESKKHMVEWKEMKEALSSSVPLEYYVFAYCVRANNKARRRIKSTWDALSAPLELVDAPPEHRGYSRGLPEEDEDILKAVAIYRHESAEFEKSRANSQTRVQLTMLAACRHKSIPRRLCLDFQRRLKSSALLFHQYADCVKSTLSAAPRSPWSSQWHATYLIFRISQRLVRRLT